MFHVYLNQFEIVITYFGFSLMLVILYLHVLVLSPGLHNYQEKKKMATKFGVYVDEHHYKLPTLY